MPHQLLRFLSKQILAVFISLGCVFSLPIHADDNIAPTISIIIDDLGYRLKDDLQALELPGPIAFSILPHGPHTERVSRIAAEQGRELLLHQPMQAIDKNKYLGPGGLTLNMSREEFIKTLNINIAKVPNIIGVNNHMGSLLTRHPGHMQWLMEALKTRGFMFIDSVTSNESVAADVARENRLPYLSRDIFLDHHQSYAYVRERFMELIKTAKRKGSALAIGHPHPATIQVLNEMLVDLDKYGVNLIGLKTLLARKDSDKQYAQSTRSSRSGL